MFLNAGKKLKLFGLLMLGITTTVVAQNTTLLNQDNFARLLNNSNPDLNGGSYQVVEDITLPLSWTPVGTPDNPASLKFNGSYHAIFGLNVETMEDNTPTGLFGYLVDSWVHSVIVHLPSVLSHGDASETGAIAGRILRTNITGNLVTGGSVETRGDGEAPFDRKPYSYAGGLVGSGDSSRIENNLNNATIHTIGNHCSAAGTVGYQTGSTVSGNLNLGTVKTEGTAANSGGLVGDQEVSKVRGNMNTGGVIATGTFSSSGGVAGGQGSSSMVSGNLNTGDVTNVRSARDAGGVVGDQVDSTTNNNVNTGDVSTMGESANAGGLTGDQIDSTTNNNVNTGDVSTMGESANAGGLAGDQEDSTTNNNVNTGDVSTTGVDADAGGVVGDQEDSTTNNNVNTGDVSTTGDANAGGAVGEESRSTASDNLNSGSVTAAIGTESSIGLNEVSESLLKMGLNGLNATLWTPGDDSQFPMLRGINAAYRDLQRINGTRYGNNSFPVELNQFADPGGSANDSLFDLAVWNVCNGYLPFLKAIGRARAEAVGIDCCKGGFACDCDGCPEPDPTTDSTISTGTTEVTTGNCPAPVGNPVFQAYDPENQWLYVVHLSDLSGNDMALIRFRGSQSPVPDERFGDCGVQGFPPIPELTEPSVTAGQLVIEPGDDHLYLTVSSLIEDKPVLLDFTLGETGATRSVYPASVGADQQLNAMKAEGGRLYVAGEADGSSVLGWFQNLEINDDQLVRDSGVGHDLDLALSGVVNHAFMVGIDNNEVFLRKYDLLARSRENAFGENGQQPVLNGVTEYSQQSVLLHRGSLYVATNTAYDSQLIIRRYDPETGAEDNSFGVSEETPEFNASPGRYRFTDEPKRRSRVRLLGNDEYLHVLKYDRSGHIFTATYNTLGNGQEALYRFTESPQFDNVADFGVAMTSGKIFLAYKKRLGDSSDNSVIQVYEVPIPNLVVAIPDNSGSPGSEAVVWPWVVAGVAVVVTAATVVTAIAVKGYLAERRQGVDLSRITNSLFRKPGRG